MAWNGNKPLAIGHHDVSALADDFKSGLFQGPDRLQVVYPREFGHGSDGHFHFADIGAFQGVRHRGQIILDRLANVFERLTLGCALRPASRQRGTTDGITFFGLDQNNRISGAHGETLSATGKMVKSPAPPKSNTGLDRRVKELEKLTKF